MTPPVVHVHIDRLKVHYLTNTWQGPVGRSVSRLARLAVKFSKVHAPKDTGRLIGSIKAKKKSGPGGIEFDLTATAPHALMMHEGTRPHTITPKQPGGMLVFFWKKVGHVVHLKSVSHPGTKAYKFLEKGFKEALAIWKVTG